jgi:hypothetical protein
LLKLDDFYRLTHKHQGGDGAQIDHGSLSNLDKDHHLHYHNDARGDARYDARYAPIAKGVTNGDSHNHVGGDGATLSHAWLSSSGDHTHSEIDTFMDQSAYRLVPKTSAYTSSSWNGDAYSTTGKTKIDLSAVFGVPAGVKAVLIRLTCRDSGSSGTNTVYLGVSPNSASGDCAVQARPGGLPNDYYATQSGICPCDANGDIYYQIAASGSGTMDCWIYIWGYFI